jgi:hypothetical protein
MAGASAILSGVSRPVPFDERERPRLLKSGDLTEARLAQLERAVFVGDPEDVETVTMRGDSHSRTGRCPHCGGPIRVTVGMLEIAPDDA